MRAILLHDRDSPRFFCQSSEEIQTTLLPAEPACPGSEHPPARRAWGDILMFRPPPQPIETATQDLPKAVAWAALKAAYTQDQLGLMQVHEHLSERQLNDALRSQFVPPKGLRLS